MLRVGRPCVAALSLLVVRAESKSAEGPAPKPNVMYIVADDLNPSAFPSYGQPDHGITPNLDQLARDGVTFLQAHSQVAEATQAPATEPIKR
jgi:predicted AlkP superfamily pyrophosphatase or phosphodiesterase